MENVIILGTGPAGLTAAIYAARANIKPLVIEGAQPGGQLTITSDVENYPGFPKGIMGPDLMKDFRAQAERFGTRFVIGDVTEVQLATSPGGTHKLKTASQTYECKALIVATGASAKLLGIPSETRLMGKGVSACATCDGFFFRNQEIAVVGGGDTACEEANFLTRFASKVYMVHRRDQLRASKIMADRVAKNPKIQMIWDSAVEEVLGDADVTGVRLKNLKTGAVTDLKVTGLFIAIGHAPNTRIFNKQLSLDANGYIVTQNGTKTNLPGVFAAGDVQDHVYRQAVTAAGTGCMAALDAERYLEGLHE